MTTSATDCHWYKTFFDSSELGVVVQVTSGEIVTANPAAERILGLTLDQMQGRTSVDPRWRAMRADHSDFPGQDHPAMVALRTGETVRGVIMGVFNPADEVVRWVEITAVPMFRDGEEKPFEVLAMFQDVTERRQALRGLSESERRYHLLAETTGAMILVHDLEGRVLFVNDVGRHLAGWTDHQTDLNVLDIVPAARRPQMAEHRRQRLEGNLQARHYEMSLEAPDGRVVPMEVRANPIVLDGEVHSILVVARDLSGRHAAEAALRRSEEAYRALVESLSDVVYSLDAAGRFTFVSPAVASYGLDPEALLGEPFTALVHPDDRAGLETGPLPVGQAHEFRVYTRAETRLVRTRCQRLEAGGAVVGVSGVLTDITEQRRTEEQLLTAQKMEAIGRLAGGVAHDFNNLLTVINSYADLALAQLRDEDPMHADLVEIGKAGARAATLTRQLLAFGRREGLAPRDLDLAMVVGEIEAMLHRVIGEDVALSTSHCAHPCTVHADRGQLEQVLMNLAVNARDAMPGGGTLALSTSCVWLDPTTAALETLPGPGAYVRLAVTDTGHGMDEQVRSRVFEPFFTTKAPGEGTGLGLATVYAIVRQAGGAIRAESTLGQGTTFVVHLPRVERPRSRASSGDRTRRVAHGSETILVVEDETSVRTLTRKLLQGAGYTVLAAADAAEAMQLMADHGRQVDLVLTDVVMPGQGGVELVEALVGRWPSIAVVFMSGYADRKLVDPTRPGERPHFVAKPFTAWELTRRVREALDARGSGLGDLLA